MLMFDLGASRMNPHEVIAKLADDERFASLRVPCLAVAHGLPGFEGYYYCVMADGSHWQSCGGRGWVPEPDVRVACWETISYFWNQDLGSVWNAWLGEVEAQQQERECSFEEAVPLAALVCIKEQMVTDLTIKTCSPETLTQVLEAIRELLPDDEAHAPLLAVVREKCPCLVADTGVGVTYRGYPLSCKRYWIRNRHTEGDCQCDGSDYITRDDYWEQAPDGALEGALIRALCPLRDAGADGIRERLLSMVENHLLGEEGDTRLAAAQAVRDHLEQART